MQATAGAVAVSWTGCLCFRRCAERVTIKGDPRWGMADMVKAAAVSRAGDQS
jgi:hypothetical protein